MSVQVRLEHCGELSTRLFVQHDRKTCLGPCIRIALDDESAGGPIEFVRVCGEHAGRRLPKSQRQSMEQLFGAVPDVFVGSGAEIRLEADAEGLPDNAIHSVRAYEQFAIAFARFNVGNFILKLDLNAEVFTSPLQDLE